MLSRYELLSNCLYRSATDSLDELAKIHNACFYRLEKLIELEHNSSDKYKLLMRFVRAQKGKNPKNYLIAINYVFDDGARVQSHGDALFFDGETLYVVECKRDVTTRRMNNVREKSRKNYSRIISYLTHLCNVDEKLHIFMKNEILAAVLTDDLTNKLVCV